MGMKWREARKGAVDFKKTVGKNAMSYEAILYETRGPVAIVTLNRPERLNAIGQAVREEVHAALEAARQDDAIRAAIITGAGKGFCSGADLSGAAARAAGGGGAPGRPPRPICSTRTVGSDAGPSASPISTSP